MLHKMGIEDETDRTLFIRNLDPQVSEGLLFELFVQAGPLIKTKIPKDNDGKQKTFGFAVYKHEVSVPYAMELLNGTMLFGRTIHVQFRSGSSHGSNAGNTKTPSPTCTPNQHGQRLQVSLMCSPYTLPHPIQVSFSPADNLQKQALMNNMMWPQMQLQQPLQQKNGGLSGLQRSQQSSGGRSHSSQQHDDTPYRQQQSSLMHRGGSVHHSRRYSGETGSGYQQNWDGHGRDNYGHQDERGSGRHQDYRSSSSSRHYDDRSGNHGCQGGRRRRY